MLKRPKILLFDEAISSLDSATGEHFTATVNQMKACSLPTNYPAR
ncbi:MAG: hypothetical protein WAW75_07400 [Gallionella sp.]